MIVLCFILLFSVAAGQSIGDIRLVEGNTRYEGRVEVLYDISSWGTVCEDHFGLADAQVVCRQLGYSTSGAVYFLSAHFGEGSGTIFIDNIQCTGFETRLIDCNYDPNTSDCHHSEDAGVRCIPDHAIRLVGGSADWEGRVEVYVSGQWGTVCDDSWNSHDAQVVCTELGYSTKDASAYTDAYFGQGSGAIHMDDVDCSGSETKIFQCSFTTNHNCEHYEDAGVACQPFTCQDVDVRLGGGSSFSGRVEVCLGGRWGTICDDGWSISDAEVVCKQLGFLSLTPGFSHYVSAYFGEGTGPVLLSDIACTGSEAALIDCGYSEINSCTHSQDAGVHCLFSGTFSEGDIRLADGSNSWEGRVEIYFSGTWGTMDDDPWTTENAQVVCRQLGYLTQDAVAYSRAHFGSGTGPIHIETVRCTGAESRLIDCSYSPEIEGEDRHIEDAGVQCQPNSCQDGDVQLVGGETEREGRVQLCLSGRWGSVCDHQWSVADANVVCAHLGYHPFGALNYSTSSTSEELSGPIFLDNVNCSGSEQSLIDCDFDYLANRCTHAQDVGVACPPAQCGSEVRLVGGETEREGRLEVCLNERWGTVCDDDWSPINTQVVCKQLGYSATGSLSAQFSPGIVPIQITSVDCDGSELTLINCSYTNNTSGCTHSNDLGIRCLPDLDTSTGAFAAIAILALPLAILVPSSTIVAIYIKKKRKQHTNRCSNTLCHTHSLQLDYGNWIMARHPMERETLQKQGGEERGREDCHCEKHVWEIIPRSSIRILKIIGEGEFGLVYKAHLAKMRSQSPLYATQTVAVKTLKGFHDHNEVVALLDEALCMESLDHPNILTLIGVCMNVLSVPCIVMPYMANGSLLAHLRRRHNYVFVNSHEERLINDTSRKLLGWCLQIAWGMEYLAAKRILHKDLAARNCMLDENMVIRIADFGFSEKLYTKAYVRMVIDGSVRLPVKWMAPESISYGVFSEKSDVWSFGVTCWEIFTGGVMPYPGIHSSAIPRMDDHERIMNRPDNQACPEDMYGIMLDCWKSAADDRPSFSQLVVVLTTRLETLAGGYITIIAA